MKQVNADELILYRDLAREPLFAPLFTENPQAADFYAALFARAADEGWRGNVFLLALADALLAADNAFSRAASLTVADVLPLPLTSVAAMELARLQQAVRLPLPGADNWQALAANFPRASLKQGLSSTYESFLYQTADDLPTMPTEQLWRRLAGFHYDHGYGPMVRHTFLTWQDGLTGVTGADPILPDALFAYERQKQQVLAHLAAFATGKPAGHLLLFGERGTGKSSLVKAAVNHFAPTGLRLVEAPRAAWEQLAAILTDLSAYRQRFVVFLDDFSFATDDGDYKRFKSVIEGGAAACPPNVMLAATSNRRHLVAESWRDREDKNEDMYLSDSTAEKLALSDRFGLTVVFGPPNQEEYLTIVTGLAARAGLSLPQEELFTAAIRWERWQNNRSGRTARQFIDHLLSQQ